MQHVPMAGSKECVREYGRNLIARGRAGPVAVACEQLRGRVMCRNISWKIVLISFCLVAAAFAQDYRVISVTDGGTTRDSKWSGRLPRAAEFPITKDVQVCDPDNKKTADLERLIVGPKTVSQIPSSISKGYQGRQGNGPARATPPSDRNAAATSLTFSLVPQNGTVDMMSSDATLHTIHMDGAATFNLPFLFPGNVNSRTVQTPGLVNLRCNGGHVWMNAEMFVAPHPVLRRNRREWTFQFTNVPRARIRSWPGMRVGVLGRGRRCR